MEEGLAKKQPHQIIFAIDLAPLKFISLLTMYVLFFLIQFNDEWRFNKHKIGHGARS